MHPEHLQFGGGSSTTVLDPLVAVGVAIAIILILILPRHKAMVPFFLAFFSIPVGQVIVLGGVHFTVHQMLILTVLGRMLGFWRAQGERFAGGLKTLDWLVVLWSLAVFTVVSLQWMQMQATIKGVGDLIESLGGYLAIRFLIPDREAFRRAIKVLALVCAIQGAFMLSEQFTHENIFRFAGAHQPSFRDGHIRSEGAMGNLWAGALAGVSIPLFLWLWTERQSRMAGFIGLAGATAMVFATYASTSWMAYGAGLVALGFWPFRNRMRFIRWGIVVILVGLHLVMHGPVWSLIEKIDLTGGSSSYHRYMLVDNCIRHFSDWWLLGTKDYVNWGWVMWDLCNQFVAIALTGGLISLALFIMIYSRSFAAIGNARKQVSGDRKEEWFFWCLGAALFANIVASFGINYLVHLIMGWCCLLSGICMTAFPAKHAVQDAAAVDDLPLTSVPHNAGNYLPLRKIT